MTNVLIVDDERNMCDLIEADLGIRGYRTMATTSARDALQMLSTENVDIVLTDLKMPGMDGLEFCRRVHSERTDLPVIVMTAFGSLETAIEAMRAGAYDFVTKPIEMEVLAISIQRAALHREMQEKISVLKQAVQDSGRLGDLIGSSDPMMALYEQLKKLADTDVSVLVTGESGTGKEMVARAIHQRSSRRDQPFVAINCAALPEALLESELFGHAKGAFTDARGERKGLFLQADGGTLFLDEIGEMPVPMQVKLLRALEENKVRAVGSDHETEFDVRLISATNRDLETALEENKFRDDLFFRINVVQLDLPPLRARGTDILLLAQFFVKQFAVKADKEIEGVSEKCAEKLLAYNWPGNVRELRNVIERAVALTRFNLLAVEDLPEKVRDYKSSQVFIGGDDPTDLVAMEEIERRYILHVLEKVDGNKTLAARVLKLDRKTLYRKLQQFGAVANESASPD